MNKKVMPIGSEYENSIRLLKNRFRVDSDVSEITLVFFREFGSSPVVLVRPDGSKIYIENDFDDDSYNWYETDNYDMISLKNPMPGPWQAVGDILPESRIMIIAGIVLNAKEIPSPIFVGETIKQTARLENRGSKVDLTSFRDVMSLSIEFVSTNNPDYANFGLGSKPVALFQDNGLAYDEYDGDGVFTGDFDLSIAEGEWKPIFTVRTPLFSREKINPNVILYPSPVNISHIEGENISFEASSAENQQQADAEDDLQKSTTDIPITRQLPHTLMITPDTEYVVPSTALIDGTIENPNGEIEKFTLVESEELAKKLEIPANAYGIYRVNMQMFIKSKSGRDLVLRIPEYTFVTSEPERAVEAEEMVAEPEQPSQENSELDEQEQNASSAIMLALAVNLCLLIIGALIVVLLIDKRNNPQNYFLLRLKKRLATISFKKPKAQTDPSDQSDAKVAT